MAVNGGHYQKNIESGTQFMLNLIDSQKTVQLPKLLFFSLKPDFSSHEKTKTV